MNTIDQIMGENVISYTINRPLILPVQPISSIVSVNYSNSSKNSSNNTMNVATSVPTSVISIFDSMINQREYITNLGTILDSPGLSTSEY